jgi:NTP pyrophosphatase (non-canonical NTP hydrolase)
MYDMTRYQAEALATESPGNAETSKMLVRTYEVTAEYLADLSAAGQKMDRVKRTIYYGKIDGELMEELMPTYPTGEKRERIEQCTRLLHGIIGLMTELGETCEEIFRFLESGGELNRENLKEEMGDFLWYINLILSVVGTNIPLVAERNIAKLRARYPNKFNSLDAIRRDRENELKALEGKTSEEVVAGPGRCRLGKLGDPFTLEEVCEELIRICKLCYPSDQVSALDAIQGAAEEALAFHRGKSPTLVIGKG